MSGKRVLPSREELFRLIHVELLSCEKAGKKLGMSGAGVHYWLKKYGIRMSLSRAKLKGRVLDPAAVVGLYESGKSAEHIGELLGVNGSTISRLLARGGVERRPAGFGGSVYKCGDGLEVRSSYEQTVADWLIGHAIPFTYEPALPFGHTMKADFLANGWYVEVWGVRNSESYVDRKRRKIALYRSHGLPLVSIHRLHFVAARVSRFERKMAMLLNPPPQGYVSRRLSPARTA